MAEHKETIDLTSEVAQTEYKQTYLGKLMQWLFLNNPTLKRPTTQEQEIMQQAALNELKTKFPQGLKVA